MAFGMRAAATLAAARRAHAAAEARGLADTPGFPRLHEAPMFGTPEFPALVRLARCKNARVLVAVVLHEDAGASSIAAKALGQLCAAPSPRALAVSSLVDALLHGGDHEKPQGARALQEMARRDKEAIGAMLSSEAIPGMAASPQPFSPRTPLLTPSSPPLPSSPQPSSRSSARPPTAPAATAPPPSNPLPNATRTRRRRW